MKKTLVTVVVVLAMIAVPMAAASSSVLSAYGESSEPLAQVQGATAGQGEVTASSGPSTLPFTGSDLVVFMAAGIALVGVGFGLRKLGRQ